VISPPVNCGRCRDESWSGVASPLGASCLRNHWPTLVEVCQRDGPIVPVSLALSRRPKARWPDLHEVASRSRSPSNGSTGGIHQPAREGDRGSWGILRGRRFSERRSDVL
jgi:hypothetical protein